MVAVLPLVGADLRRDCSGDIVCTDARATFMGACLLRDRPDLVEPADLWKERWRFRRIEPEEWRPRRRAVEKRLLDVFQDPSTARPNDGSTPLPEMMPREGFPDSATNVCALRALY